MTDSTISDAIVRLIREMRQAAEKSALARTQQGSTANGDWIDAAELITRYWSERLEDVLVRSNGAGPSSIEMIDTVERR